MTNAKVPYYAAAAATAVAGMLHLMLGPGSLGFNVNQGILFVVGGIAQVFWIVPMIRRWGTVWYGIGIAGTAVFMALFFITRVADNPITGRAGMVNSLSLAVEVFEAIFIGLAIAILVHESRKKVEPRSAADQGPRDKRKAPILAGVVVALILIGVFVLPMAMPRPAGGPPLPGGGPSGQPQVGTAGQNATSVVQNCTLTPSLIEIEETPQQTEGPYFVDGAPNRVDITSDSSSGSIEEGIPLALNVTVYDSEEGTCVPVGGAQVDIWHSNSQGIYSGVEGSSGTDFLRGYQLTDANGTASFSTIYPGWYEGRAIRIHVKVRTSEGTTQTFEWTSQFYLPNSVNDQVHTQPPYSTHGPVGMTNEEDGIYTGASTDGLVPSNAGEHLMLALNDSDGGYAGAFNIVLDLD